MIIKTTTTYIAYDGKKFDNEESCIKYENSLMPETVILMSCNQRLTNDRKGFDDADIIIILSREDGIKLNNWCKNNSYYAIWNIDDEARAGIYKFEYKNESPSWVKID